MNETGENYRDGNWQYRASDDAISGGIKHMHCLVCWVTISKTPGLDTVETGWTDGPGQWLCPSCYNRVVVNEEDPWAIRNERKT